VLFDRASDFTAHRPVAGVGELAHGLGDVRRHTRSNRDAPGRVYEVLIAHILFFGYAAKISARMTAKGKGSRRPAKPKVVVGVEANESDLTRWGRAAALRRQELPRWIRQSLDEHAAADELRQSPRPLSA
jgi:hypothetical protein